VVDVPEIDFTSVAPGREVGIRLLATGRELRAPIARRAPAADLATRTVRVEIDLPDERHELPVNTTAEVFAEVGEPVPATALPLPAADVQGGRANLFAIRDGHAHQETLEVLGEKGSELYVDPALVAGTPVVVEGRRGLREGDSVSARERGAETWEQGVMSADAGTGVDR